MVRLKAMKGGALLLVVAVLAAQHCSLAQEAACATDDQSCGVTQEAEGSHAQVQHRQEQHVEQPVQQAEEQQYMEVQDVSGTETQQAPPPHTRVIKSPAKVCVVIRTYWGHGRHSKSGLRQLFQSLQRQKHQNWEAIVLVMDTKPFEELHGIIAEFGNKAWVYAELIGGEYQSRGAGGMWSTDYHGNLYNLTDQGIRACPRDTDWLLVTNGDNEYSADLFQALEESSDVDLIAFDFYSRYARPTGPPCYRFAATPEGPPCKRNLVRWCHTDLGANVLYFPRFVEEDRRFGAFEEGEHTADHFDGLMLETLLADGWQYRYLEGRCLYEHSPTPQRCARLGGVWDDSNAAQFATAGGQCITRKLALQHLEQYPADYELVAVQLANDGHLSSFLPEGVEHPAEVMCLRLTAHEQHASMLRLFYGPKCCDPVDEPSFDWNAWEEYQKQLMDLEEQRREQARLGEEAYLRGEAVLNPEAMMQQPEERVKWEAVPDPPPRHDPNHTPKYRARYTPYPPQDAVQGMPADDAAAPAADPGAVLSAAGGVHTEL